MIRIVRPAATPCQPGGAEPRPPAREIRRRLARRCYLVPGISCFPLAEPPTAASLAPLD